MKNFIKNLGRQKFYQLVVSVLLLSDFGLMFNMSSTLRDQEIGAKKMLSMLPGYDLSFAREIYSLMVNSILTSLGILLFLNLVNYLFFLRHKKFSYHYTIFMVKLSIPLTLFTGYTLSKELNPLALLYLIEGAIFCLLAYAFRFYPYEERVRSNKIETRIV
jgi:hypothetical protein